jgi:kumamolisin
MVKVPGNLPPLLKTSHVVSAVDGNTPLEIAIGLHLRNADGLAHYAEEISRADNGMKRTLSPQQIMEAYAPLPASQQAVTDYMQRNGFQTTKTFKNHMIIGFKGTVAQAEQAFNVQIDNYQSANGQTFYGPSTDPSIPASIVPFVESITGLDNAAKFSHGPVKTIDTASNSSSAINAANPCQTPGSVGQLGHASYYTPSQVATGYNLSTLYNQGFKGEGQVIALVEFASYSTNDVNTYIANCGVGGSIPINRFQPFGSPAPDQGGTVEADLDVELLTSAVPHLAGIYVYEAPNSGSLAHSSSNALVSALSLWSQIINDAVPVISTSWGTCEANLSSDFVQQENSLFTLAAAQGQSIFAASGDFGSDDCHNGGLAVDDPAAQPFVTGVGGTSLTLNGDNSYNSETVWNDQSGTGGTGGGGISSNWQMPTWQNAPGVVGTYSSGTPCSAPGGTYCREVPDVSLMSGGVDYYPIYTLSNWYLVGGTSAAAPMWAAMTALANQKSVSEGYFNLGFLNPSLYQIGQNATAYANAFHDITSGNNNIHGGPQYPATPTYDMASGLGTYNAANMADTLIDIAKAKTGARAAPANTTWYFAEGAVGNGFREFITILNPNATQAATVNITYLFDNKPTPTVTHHTVAASSRATITVNDDVGFPANSGAFQSLSAIVQSDIPIVAERPMYFNFLNTVPSGTDVVGATNVTQKTFYFAEGDQRQNGTQSYHTYLTVLNPSTTQTANVTFTYYANGQTVGTKTIAVGPLMRGTSSPGDIGIQSQVAIQATSDIGVVIERPLYFKDNVPTAGGTVTGAASAVGATALGNDWLFAEGYTGGNFQEYLVLANFTNTDTTANVKLEYSNGQQQNVPVQVKAFSQTYFDVNNANANPVSGCNCTTTTENSAEVTSSSASIVAERLMYFHFNGFPGGTDTVGERGPSTHANYAFAEGYTATNFTEFLTLQNPNTQVVTVVVTMFANGNGTIVQKMLQLKPQSRTTMSINNFVVPIAQAYGGNYEVSINVQALNGTVVAERPLYFNYAGTTGATDVLGYTGG